MSTSELQPSNSDSGKSDSGKSDSHDAELDQAIVEYMQACESGQFPDKQTLLEKYARVAGQLKEFFDQQSQLTRLMSPVRKFSEMVSTTESEYPIEFGEFELLAEIGRGGMGVIYEATQKNLRRRVALKMIRESRFASRSDLMRFRAEAEASAALEHPNIVPIYGVGEIEDRPYFTMKLVTGGTLKDALGEGAFAPRHAANVALAIARAVSYAHQRGILHRDLKPANILLDAIDDSHSDGSSSETVIRQNDESQSPTRSSQRIGRTKNDPIDVVPMISDFGLAKRINDERDLTMTGAVLGTPSFMSPEQAAGQAGLTTSTDVYGVGAILYNMLSGVPPFTGRNPVEITGNVLTKTPSSIRFNKSGVDLDLETICMKCLEKDPSHRYLTAGELAEDLQRYLNGEPISARRSSSFEQLVKWSRRNPTLTGLFSAIAALLMVVFIGSLIFSFRTNADAVKLAEVNHDLKEQEKETASQRDQAVRALFESKFAEVAARRSSGESGQRFKALAAARQAVEQLQYVNATDQELFELRSETAGCLGLADVEEIGTWDVPLYGDYVFAFNPTLTMFAHQTEVGQPVRIYETDDLVEAGDIALTIPIAEFSAGEGVEFTSLVPRFSPCGNYLQVWTSIDSKPTFTVFDMEQRKTVFQKQNVKSGCVGRYNGNPQLVIEEAGELVVLDPVTLEEQRRFANPFGGRGRMRISPDGQFLAQFGYGGLVVSRLEDGEAVWKVGGFYCSDLAWHPFLPQVAVTNKTEMQVWEIEGSEPSMVFPKHPNEVCQVEYSPDARVLVTSTWGNTSRFWDAQSGELIFSLAGFVDHFSSDGLRLGFSGAKSGILRFENDRLKRTISDADKPHYGSRASSLDVHPNDRWAAIGTGKDVRICDLKTGKRLVDLPGGCRDAKFHPDGKSLFVSGKEILKWPIQQKRNDDGALHLTIGPPENIVPDGIGVEQNTSFAIDPSGQFLAFETAGVHVIDLGKRELIRKIDIDLELRSVSLSHGAGLIAAGNHHEQNARIYDGATGELVQTIQTPTHARPWLNADGSLVAVSFSDTAEVYETRSGNKLYSLKDADFEVAWPVSFSPNGKYLLFNLRKPSGLLLVDAKSGQQLIRIPSATGDTPRDAPSRMTGDGYLVTCGNGNGLSTWDLGRIRGKLQELGLDWGDSDLETLSVGTGSDGASSDGTDAKIANTNFLPPTVEVLWADSRQVTLNRELKRIRQVYGKKVARLSIEGWLADAPSDVVLLVAHAELNWRQREGEKAIESLTRAIDLADDDSVAPASFLRANYYRNTNQCDKSIDEYKRYLKIENGDEENEEKLTVKQQLAWELARSNRNMDDAKLAKLLAVEAAEKQPSLYSQKTLAVAMYRNGEFLEAVKTIDALHAENDPLGQDSYGSLFIKSMALKQLGRREEAVAAFDREQVSIEKHKITSQKRVSDWVQLETEAKRMLELGDGDKQLRWNAFELAATARWDCGRISLQYFDNVRRFKAPPESGENESTETEETNETACHLFWNPIRDNGRLQITIEVPQSGVYDGHIALCKSSDYGNYGLVVNGSSIGLEFDGFYEFTAHGAGIELAGLELKKGANVFSFVCKGKSPVSAGYYAGIEYLELRKK